MTRHLDGTGVCGWAEWSGHSSARAGRWSRRYATGSTFRAAASDFISAVRPGPMADSADIAGRDEFVALINAPTQLGFLTVLHEASGYLGGYLVTNVWGRPVEFRLSTAVQPNRVQQILYGQTLSGYLHGELIGKTLVEKTAAPAALIFTDRQAVLDLRNTLELPIVWVASGDSISDDAGVIVRAAGENRPALVSSAKHPNDLPRINSVLEHLDSNLDLIEPFSRIREAIAEARKLGVTNRG